MERSILQPDGLTVHPPDAESAAVWGVREPPADTAAKSKAP